MNHKINDPRHPWSKLVAAARQVSDDRDTTAPYGFATRVTALAFARENRVMSVFERFALRAVGMAGLLALCGVAVNYQALSPSSATGVSQAEEMDVIVPADDAVAIILDIAD